LDQLQQSKSGQIQAIALKAELLAARGKLAEAEAALAILPAGTPAKQRHSLLLRRAQLQLQQGNTDQAKQSLAALADELPNNANIAEMLAELAIRAGDLTDLERWIDRLKKSEGSQGTNWRLFRAQQQLILARRASDAKTIQACRDEAIRLQREIQKLRPEWVPGLLLKARANQVGSPIDDDVSIAAYSDAIRLGERRLTVYQELIFLLYRQNRIEEALSYRNRLGEANDLPEGLATLAMAVDARTGHLDRAIEAARADVKQRPEDANSYLQLGQLLSSGLPNEEPARTNRLNESEEALLKARHLAPRDVRTWSALLVFYSAFKKTDEVAALIKEVDTAEAFTAETRPFFLAQAYNLLGDTEHAAEQFQKAMAANPERVPVHLQAASFFFQNDPDEAQKCARRVLALEPNNGPAQRMLALLIAAREGGTSKMAEAWKIVEQLEANGSSDPGDQRFRALMLWRRGGQENRARALSLLESLVNDGRQASEIDRLMLARLYEVQGNSAQARAQLRALAEADQPRSAELAAYVDLLLREKKWREATSALDRLCKLEPENSHLRSLMLRSRWLKLKGQTDSVEPLVKSYLDVNESKLASQTDRAQLFLAIANLYESLELPSLAETSFQAALQADAKTYPAMAEWLVKHDRMGDAIQLILQAAESDSTPRAAMALCTTLTIGQPTSQQRARCEPEIEMALQRHAKHAGLLFCAATLRLVEGKSDQAADLLRRTLAVDPDHLQAMNNLAMVLAQKTDQRDEALVHLDRALAIAGNDRELLDSKGWVLLLQGKAAEAERLLLDAISTPPADPRHCFHLALACQKQGKSREAERYLEQARNANLSEHLLTPEERQQLRELEDAVQ
jgi:Flp pilus assembly protein TadD